MSVDLSILGAINEPAGPGSFLKPKKRVREYSRFLESRFHAPHLDSRASGTVHRADEEDFLEGAIQAAAGEVAHR